MDWKKIAPWNWFKEEEPHGHTAEPSTAIARSADPFTAFMSEFERRFAEGFPFPLTETRRSGGPVGRAALLRPSVDISEGKKAYTVRAELPGVEIDDVSIQAADQTLVIRAEKRQEREDDDEGYHCVERSYGAVQRVLSLPEDADAEAIDAKFKNGVLKLRIPKHAASASSPRKIEVLRG